MHRLAIVLALASLVFSATGSSAHHDSVVVSSSLQPTITVVGDADQVAVVRDTVAAFVELNMALPDLTVHFHRDEAGCDGHLGLFDFVPEPWRVDICSSLPFVIAHELGHAWERANLSGEDRQTYINFRGLTEWQNLERPRNEQGIEDVAFNIQLAIVYGPGGDDEVARVIAVLWELAAEPS